MRFSVDRIATPVRSKAEDLHEIADTHVGRDDDVPLDVIDDTI
jgi:hypothetical protein